MAETKIEIREMVEDDINNVLKVDQEIFTSSWTEEIFKQEVVENKHAHYFVVETKGSIIGYSGLWIVEDSAQITNIALLSKFRGYKIGEKLFGFTVQYAMRNGARQLS